MAKKTETEKDPATVPGLRVTSRKAGFRRAGWSWSTAPIELPAANFTGEQIAALKAEPLLTVEEIELEVA